MKKVEGLRSKLKKGRAYRCEDLAQWWSRPIWGGTIFGRLSKHYNSLGLGATQLYNRKRIYNHKKHEDVKLGNKVYEFRRKPKFPKILSREYLVVDLLNNLKT